MRFLRVLLLLGVIAAGIAGWAWFAWDAPGPPARSGPETVILIPAHSPTHDIAGMLEQKGLVKSAILFELDARLKGAASRLKAGEYAIPSGASMGRIAGILVEGKSIQHKLTAAEGLTSEMIWKLVKADPVLVGDAGAVPAEGTLLPETYLFTRGETRRELLSKMARAADKVVQTQWDGRAEGLPFKSPREAIILASIVEKETRLSQERPHVASVFINRLKSGMKLQTDPTIIYDLTRGYPLGRGIKQSELTAASPHNTYVIDGLPPGPICNPGKDSIAAVLHPAQTSDLYFVATGQGGHVFAATNEEQARNVAAYRAFERGQQAVQSPDSRQVESNGRVESADVPLPDGAMPKLKAGKAKPARKALRHRG
jgi:UPF0755 protein